MSPLQEHYECPSYLITVYARTFISRRDCYPLQLADGSYRTIYEPQSTDLLERHIKGEITLGVYALDADSKANWLCLDADSDEEWAKLWQFAKIAEKKGITPYVETSRRGGHLWLFTPTLSGKNIRRFGLYLIDEYGLNSGQSHQI